MKSIVKYLQAVKAEFMKVSWPSRRQLIRLVIAVLIFSVIMAIALGLMDFGFSTMLKQVITKG